MTMQYKILFTFEVNTERGGVELGRFICVPWPEMYQGPDGQKNFEAARRLMDSTPDPMADIKQFLHFASLRPKFDSKASDPMLITHDESFTREQFAAWLATLTPEQKYEMKRTHRIKPYGFRAAL